MSGTPPTVGEVATSSTRRIGLAVAVGAACGLLIGGVGGRLVMFVLARVNSEQAGLRTDDGFEVGRFTLSGTVNLLIIATIVGIVGGAIFYLLRGLRFGPPWFRVLSMPIGATLVVGSLLVHSDGIDFRVLQPLWLAVALTLAIPFAYTLVLARLADRWLGDESVMWDAVPAGLVWAARLALVAVAVLALVGLTSTIVALTGNPFQFD